MQLVLIEHTMVDSVPPVQDLSSLQDPSPLQDPGIQVLIAGWHTTPAGISPRCSPPTVSAAATSSICGFPGGPLVCLWAGALGHPARVAHLRDSTTAMLRAREGGEAANQGRESGRREGCVCRSRRISRIRDKIPATGRENTFPCSLVEIRSEKLPDQDPQAPLSERLLPGTMRRQQLSLHQRCGNVPCWGGVE